MTEPLISVIIPAYNAEQTLERAVTSIQNEFENKIDYEILIIENGSVDNTLRAAQKFACANMNVLQSKKGVSNARNRGIEAAKGHWLMFVDADDMLMTGVAEILRKAGRREDVDFFLFGHKVGGRQRRVCKEEVLYTRNTIIQLWKELLSKPTKYLQVWAKLFRRDIIVNNRVKFDDNLRLAEDSDFTLQYLKYCESVELCHECIYDYSVDTVSTMRAYDGQKVIDYAKAMELTKKKITDELPEIKEAYWQYVLTHFQVAMVNEVFSTCNPKQLADKIADMKRASEIYIFHQAILKTEGQNCSKTNQVLGALLRKKLYFLAAMIYEARAWQKKVKK